MALSRIVEEKVFLVLLTGVGLGVERDAGKIGSNCSASGEDSAPWLGCSGAEAVAEGAAAPWWDVSRPGDVMTRFKVGSLGVVSLLSMAHERLRDRMIQEDSPPLSTDRYKSLEGATRDPRSTVDKSSFIESGWQ